MGPQNAARLGRPTDHESVVSENGSRPSHVSPAVCIWLGSLNGEKTISQSGLKNR